MCSREGWEGWFVTQAAFQRRADALAAALDGNHPRAHLPGWIVAYVLRVAALEVGYPVPLIVLMESNDRALTHA